MTRILIIKIGALGDVLRTTSILQGLHQAYPDAHIEWVTAEAARQLVESNGLVSKTHTIDPELESDYLALAETLGGEPWHWVISLDDERQSCELATALSHDRRSGAFVSDEGELIYTDDVAPWFDMGLLSRYGKEAADRRKVLNERSHAAIFADMLGIRSGKPVLNLPADALARAARQLGVGHRPPGTYLIGLNTSASGRWASKALPPERVIEFAAGLHHELDGAVSFVLLGGLDETARNGELLRELRARPESLDVIDGGLDNSMLDFAALIDQLDLLLTSDSLAMHIGISRNTRIVAFFAPTSAAEIELYGLGRKVISLSPDYCSFRPDADNTTITAERLVEAASDVLRDLRG